MHMIKDIHNEIVFMSEKNARGFKILRLLLLIVVGLQCFMCLYQCSDVDFSAVTTLTIDETVLSAGEPIEATSKVTIIPSSSCGDSKPSFQLIGIRIMVLLGKVCLHLFHLIGFLLRGVAYAPVWIIEALQSGLWCYPRGSHTDPFEQHSSPIDILADIFDADTDNEDGVIANILGRMNEHRLPLLICLALLCVVGLLKLALLIKYWLLPKRNNETLLKINNQGLWEFAP